MDDASFEPMSYECCSIARKLMQLCGCPV